MFNKFLGFRESFREEVIFELICMSKLDVREGKWGGDGERLMN